MLQSSNQSHDDIGTNILQIVLVSTLDAVELISILVVPWDGIKVGILHVVLVSCRHDATGKHKTSEKVSKAGSKDHPAVGGRDCQTEGRHGDQRLHGRLQDSCSFKKASSNTKDEDAACFRHVAKADGWLRWGS